LAAYQNLHRDSTPRRPSTLWCWWTLTDDPHFLTTCRYVERNALRANLVAKAQDWKWSSLWRWNRGNAKEKSILSAWPVRRTPNWLDYVNEPQTEL
jgi:putative transposase